VASSPRCVPTLGRPPTYNPNLGLKQMWENLKNVGGLSIHQRSQRMSIGSEVPRSSGSLVRHSKNPVHRAVAAGRVDKVREALTGEDPDDILGPLNAVGSSSRVNVVDEATGYTPLHLAVVCGKHEVVEFLLGEGADVNRPREDATKDTALTLAAKRGTSFRVVGRCGRVFYVRECA
jgi:hypothetical protein